MEIPSINQRLRQLIDYKANGNESEFAKLINVKQQKINRLFKIDDRNGKYPSISTDIIVGITEMCVDISMRWFLIDKGSMLREQSTINTDEVENLKDLVKLQREKIQSLELELDNFKNKNIYEESKEYSS